MVLAGNLVRLSAGYFIHYIHSSVHHLYLVVKGQALSECLRWENYRLLKKESEIILHATETGGVHWHLKKGIGILKKEVEGSRGVRVGRAR